MTKILLSAFLYLLSSHISAADVKLEIKIPEDYSGKVSLLIIDAGEETFLQPSFNNLSFTFTKELIGKYAALIFIYQDSLNNFAEQFIISPGSKSIKFPHKFLSEANFKKYELNDVFIFEKTKSWKDIKQYLGSTNDSLKFYSNLYNTSKDSISLLNYNRQIEITNLELLDYFKNNKNSFLDFWYFTREVLASLDNKYAFDLYSSFLSSFSKKIQESNEGKIVSQHLLGLMTEKKGQLAPNFTLKDINGNLISLERLKGKYVLLSLWATWCSPCVEEIPKLQSLYNSCKNKNIEFISISYDQSIDDLKKGLDKYDMPWTQIFSTNNLRYLYGADALPALYLIDTAGVIQFSLRENDFTTLEKLLETNLKN